MQQERDLDKHGHTVRNWPTEPTTTDKHIFQPYEPDCQICGGFAYAPLHIQPTTTDSGIELTNKKLWALCAEYQRTILKLEEQVGREIRVRNNVIAELEAELAKYREVWLDDYVKGLESERDELKERLRTTRLEQAAKAFQVDELESQVAALTADKQAWMAENTELLTQIERLTEEFAAIESRPESP